MFFLSLALLGQSVTLDADTGKAARQCLPAFLLAARSKDPGVLRGLSHQLYLGMTAAAAESPTDNVVDRSIQIMREANDPARSRPEDNAGLIPACDARFPLARATAPAPLPADPDERDILCTGVTTLLAGAAGALARYGDSSFEKEISQVLARLTPRFEAIRKARNVADTPDARHALTSGAFRASLERGNLEAIYQSCKKLPA
ncbi:hypothetical protein ACCC88_20890 [Sphingomonas sp. Sphisp140]|uniref:hypothetical protein n=1 Tax=unclassified Sphingomonas TaxID=196159 RepID=UPI0039AFA83E